MEIKEVTNSLRGYAVKYSEMGIEERHKNNIDWGRVSLLNQFSDLLDRLADEIEEDISLHFEPIELYDTQEKIDADVEKVSEHPQIQEEIRYLLYRQRELDAKNNG